MRWTDSGTTRSRVGSRTRTAAEAGAGKGRPCGGSLGGMAAGWAAALFCLSGAAASGATVVPIITSARLVEGGLALEWSGDGWAYEVRTASDLAAGDWRPLIATVRTDAVVPVPGRAAFFRVAAIGAGPDSLVLTVTDAQSGEAVTFSGQPKTNPDLVFDGPTDLNGLNVHRMVLEHADRMEYDILFNGQGGFQIRRDGVPSGHWGVFTAAPGPEPNEFLYDGFLSNQNGIFTFSATATTASQGLGAAASTLKSSGAGDASGAQGALEGLAGAAAWLYCLPGFALQQVGCGAACFNQGLICAFQWPPKQADCKWVTTITWPLGAEAPICKSDCLLGCK